VNHRIVFGILFALAGTAAVILGMQRPAFAASADCNGTVKWNGSITSPQYYWKLDEDNDIVFCPKVVCDGGTYNCTLERSFPTPPENQYHDTCFCPSGMEGTCSTDVATDTPGGPIQSVTCIPNSCEQCDLKAQGGPDPNGHYDVQCECTS